MTPSGPFQSKSMVVEEASMCWTEACRGLHERGAKTGTIVQKTNLYDGQMIKLKQIQLYNCERFSKSVACVTNKSTLLTEARGQQNAD